MSDKIFFLSDNMSLLNPLITPIEAKAIAETVAVARVWDNATDYFTDDIIFHEGKFYKATANITNGSSTPDAHANWECVIRADFIPIYDPNKTYPQYFVVGYVNGSNQFNLYISNTTIAVGEDPESTPAKWDGALISNHGSLTGLGDDDHTQYHNNARGDARYHQKSEFVSSSSGAPDANKPIKLDGNGQLDPSLATSDHGDLVGLDHDDHPQYLNNSRGDNRYHLKEDIDAMILRRIEDIQYDSSLDPGFFNSGDRYIITDPFDLGASFGSIPDLDPDDVVEYDGYDFYVVFKPSQATAFTPIAPVAMKETVYAWFNGIGWKPVMPPGFVEENGNIGVGISPNTNAKLDVWGVIKPRSYAKASLPAHVAGGIIYVTNDVGGAVLAFSDGTNWRRVTDRAIIS